MSSIDTYKDLKAVDLPTNPLIIGCFKYCPVYFDEADAPSDAIAELNELNQAIAEKLHDSSITFNQYNNSLNLICSDQISDEESLKSLMKSISNTSNQLARSSPLTKRITDQIKAGIHDAEVALQRDNDARDIVNVPILGGVLGWLAGAKDTPPVSPIITDEPGTLSKKPPIRRTGKSFLISKGSQSLSISASGY